MNKRFSIVIMMLISTLQMAHAQWDVQFSDFTTLKSFYNPAISGTDGLLDVSLAYSLQMAGYENAPKTMYAGVNMPIYFLSSNHGAGLSLMSDEIGMFKTSKLTVQYAYNTKLGDKDRLAIGFQGSMMSETIDPSGMKLEDASDPAFPTSSADGKTFDLGAGFYYYSPKWWAGLSVQHLLEPSIVMSDKYQLDISRVFYFMAGGNIKIKNTLLSLQPAVMVQSDLQSWREDLQCRVTYEYESRQFFVGLCYSPNVSVTAMIGSNFHGVQLGYSYQMYTQGVGLQNGSHELVLNYKTNLDLFKKGKNLHKSVRFL